MLQVLGELHSQHSKPLLLFFYFGFLIPIFKSAVEFPYGNLPGPNPVCCWPSVGTAKELAKDQAVQRQHITLGSWWLKAALNVIGTLAYFLLKQADRHARVDRATVAGSLSDSARDIYHL